MYVINLNIGSWNRSFYIVCIKMFFFLINCVLKIWNNGKLGGGVYLGDGELELDYGGVCIEN